MDTNSIKLNDLLVNTYDLVTKIEERMLQDSEKMDVNIRELHIIEYISDNGDVTISDIAEKMDITLPSVTVAIKKLEKKGYVEKKRSPQDKRLVYVSLTRTGRKVDTVHKYFHKRMVMRVTKNMDDDKLLVLIEGLTQVEDYLTDTLETMKKNRSER